MRRGTGAAARPRGRARAACQCAVSSVRALAVRVARARAVEDCRPVARARWRNPKEICRYSVCLRIAPSDPQPSPQWLIHPPQAREAALPSTRRPTGSRYTLTSASTQRSTAESPSGARARGALARHTRPRAAARAYPVLSASQRRRQRPDSRRRSEAVEGFHLLRAHADIAAREGMRHAGDMQECVSQHAEPCQYHYPRPFHAKGAKPRPASQPSAAARRALLLAPNSRRGHGSWGERGASTRGRVQ